MHAPRRLAAPARVHQFWDALDRCSASQGPVDFERITAIVTSIHKVPKDELNRELESAIRDELIISDVIQTQKREEAEIYKLPNPESIVKGDHDWYCFQCHLGAGGPVVACEDCPRIFHLDCLPDDRKPQKDLFVCPSCHIMATKPSAELLNLKPKQLNTLLQYSCSRFKEWMIPFMNSADGEAWAIASEREAKDDWRYDLLVYFNIDLTQMLEKCVNLKYQSLEEFQVDCETLIHSIGVYFGPDSSLKGQAVPASFYREVMHDIQEIKLCHDCFRRSNEKDHAWWFCLPCTTPHEVVWAKQSGYPYWPAKIMKIDGTKYDVRYFGGNYERGMIEVKNIQPIDTPLTTLRIRRTAAWNDAYDELQKFQDIAKNPEKVSSLPTTKGGKGSSPPKGAAKGAAAKRAAAASPPEEVITTKKSRSEGRKSAPARGSAKSTPAPTRGRKSAASVTSAVTPNSSSVNGVSPSSSKKKAATSATLTRRDSSTRTSSISPVGNRSRLSSDQNVTNIEMPDCLDIDDMSFLNSLEEVVGEAEDATGDIYFSDEEQDDLHEKVSEDAVSSSVNETRGNRNAYTQVNFKGLASSRFEALREYVVKHLSTIKERHASEISQNKKKQWCYHCEREAIYHCCWNTAYCSIECQQSHWTKEHKRLCRRVRRVSGNNSQVGDDY